MHGFNLDFRYLLDQPNLFRFDGWFYAFINQKEVKIFLRLDQTKKQVT